MKALGLHGFEVLKKSIFLLLFAQSAHALSWDVFNDISKNYIKTTVAKVLLQHGYQLDPESISSNAFTEQLMNTALNSVTFASEFDHVKRFAFTAVDSKSNPCAGAITLVGQMSSEGHRPVELNEGPFFFHVTAYYFGAFSIDGNPVSTKPYRVAIYNEESLSVCSKEILKEKLK